MLRQNQFYLYNIRAGINCPVTDFHWTQTWAKCCRL